VLSEFSESSSQLESDLTDRQRYWLGHLREAEQRGEPVKSYAKRLGLASSSMYEAKRRLRGLGVLEAAPMSPPRAAEFIRVAVADRAPSTRPRFQVRLASGAVLEWSEAPQGKALHELIGLVS
jgi:hypothetical protein